MPLTIEQTANAILRSRHGRGRGTVFQPAKLARDWLESTPWFVQKFVTKQAQDEHVMAVAKSVRSMMAKKAARTKKENKRKAQKHEADAIRKAAKAAEDAKQCEFKF